MDSFPIKLRVRPAKMAFLLLGSLAFVAGGIWMAPQHPLIGYSSAVFFGLCAVVGAISLLPGSSYLVLTEEGFTFASLFRKSFVPWSSVQEFVPIRIFLNRLVGWKYSPTFRAHSGFRRVNVALSRTEAALPDTYGMSAADLAKLMNQLRSRYGNAAR